MHSPLEILIGLHYWTSPGPYAANEPAHANSPAVDACVKLMVEAGLLEPDSSERGPYKSTDALKVWVEALCSVPWPVQEWIIPKVAAGRLGGRARADALSPERRTEIAKQAANARWNGDHQ